MGIFGPSRGEPGFKNWEDGLREYWIDLPQKTLKI